MTKITSLHKFPSDPPIHRTACPFVVAIVGGSGSGKTTLARAIADRLGRDRVSFVSQDAYYRDRGDLPPSARAELNYDVPEALDRPLLSKHLRALRAGRTVRMPVYSFESHTRTGQARLAHPLEIILAEGLLLLFDATIRQLFDLKIFVDAPPEVRLERRMRRDMAERGRTAPAILRQFNETVQPAHERYVEPTKSLADLVLPNMGHPEECLGLAVTAITTRIQQRANAESRSVIDSGNTPCAVGVPMRMKAPAHYPPPQSSPSRGEEATQGVPSPLEGEGQDGGAFLGHDGNGARE